MIRRTLLPLLLKAELFWGLGLSLNWFAVLLDRLPIGG